MIVARAPARISFGGGGTDLAAYYERFGGLVVSTAIDCHCTVEVRPTGDRSIRLRSESVGVSQRWRPGERPTVEGRHRLGAAVIERFFNEAMARTGADVVIRSKVPHGSGLGSSSTVAVALTTALAAFTGQRLTRSEIAEIACDIEINRLGMPIGRQDQYASAFGGLNVIEFERGGTRVTPLELPQSMLDELDSRVLLFSTGRTRQAADILRQQKRDTSSDEAVQGSLHAIKDLAVQMVAALQAGELDAFGRLMDTSWQQKRRLSRSISSGEIDGMYRAARDAGALGGKISGAGGGGFLMLYCPPGSRGQVRKAMSASGLQELPFRFDQAGAVLLSPMEQESADRRAALYVS